MRSLVLLRGILLGLVLLVSVAGPASAHAALVGSDPEDGSSLDAAPTTITLTFNENIAQPAYVAVAAPDGTQVEVTDIRAVDDTVTATVQDVDQRGRYSASYRVVSADGHPVTGTLRYDVTTGRSVTQVDAPAQDEGFLHRHSSHLFWGILAAVVAIALLLAPLRRRHDADSA
ncbi:MAG: copper resistance CopC family protein [Aeromicrobium sp.]